MFNLESESTTLKTQNFPSLSRRYFRPAKRSYLLQETTKRLIYIAARLTSKLLRRLFWLKESYINNELPLLKKGGSFERLNKAGSHSTGIGLFCLPIN